MNPIRDGSPAAGARVPRGSRREFFGALARWTGAAATAAAAWLALRRGPRDRSRETCVGDGVCSRCGSLEDCGLPQALSLKAAKGQG